MKIRDYEFDNQEWKIGKVSFEKVNLIVGDSGTGKTRLLNTIFNLGVSIVQSKLLGKGRWIISLDIDNSIYDWEINAIESEDEIIVESEHLFKDKEIIIERTMDSFIYNNSPLPKLRKNVLSVSMLGEETLIQPLYKGFLQILRRSFFSDELEKNVGFMSIGSELKDKTYKRGRELFEIYKSEFPLSLRLDILRNNFPEIYQKITGYFIDTFNFVEEMTILNATDIKLSYPGFTPVFCIKERYVDKWIPIHELSSGMQKTLLILTDLFSLPPGCIYLIDEYENSLGISAINVLPNVLFSEELDLQLLITSHHPYIIQNFPVKNWYVAHRRGSEVKFAYGEELETRYGLSKQDKYIQLLNDPYFSEGVE